MVYKVKHMRPVIKAVDENNTTGKDLIGLEIGVKSGLNAWNILNTLPIKMLYLIDSYIYYPGIDANETRIKHAIPIWKEQLNNNVLKKYPTQTNLIQKISDDAVEDIPNNLDFIYVDGNSKYEYRTRDYNNYYPKVIKGGIFGGRCLTQSSTSEAVDDLIKKYNLKLYQGEDKKYIDYSKTNHIEWWVIKK